ncbi:hypothetical protein SAMN02910400_01087 [Lachnospiraceae bacterium C10]|nr:hypothetical protein SAMN02910400_01087 [Lachnospiraceae bacterium C10]
MNIKMQSINLFSNNGLKSTQDRLDRQAKRDNQIAYFEQQKENLKNMKSDSIEDISRKLDLLHGYDDQIAAAKAEYNNSQMFHMLDEARERAEKIAEEAEKYAPKTPEERLEDMIEEATGVDKDAGMLAEAMNELEEIAEEMTEETVEELDEMSEELEEVENTDKAQAEMEAASKVSTGDLPEKYKRIDYRI